MNVSTWEKITTIATAAGGLGAMLGAIFAWLAARSSVTASRDARDALAASLKPQVQLFLLQDGAKLPVIARVVVVGPLSPAGLAGVMPASDVVLEFNLASGGHGSNSISILEPNGSRWAREPPYLSVVVKEPSDVWPPPDGDHVKATVSFSDTRKVATYQQSVSADLHRSAEAGLVSFQNVTDPIETRVSPRINS